MKKQKRWHRSRHAFFYRITGWLFGFYAKIKLGFKGEKFDNRRQPYLFLYNHQTPYDQQLLYLCARRQPYTVATEDLFTMGALSKFIRYGQAPIPFKKSMNDVTAVMTCFRIAREGYSIALAPEGNRTFTGTTVNIKPSIVKLIKALKLPVAIFLVRGGYRTLPRYADKPRRAGGVTAGVTRVIPYEEYRDMPNDELYSLIEREMYVDESDWGVPVKNRRRAEFAERALYRCPCCGALGRLTSKGSSVTCAACGSVGTMDVYGRFEPPFPVRTVKEWAQDQEAWINSLDIEDGADKPLFSEKVCLRQLISEEFRKVTLEKNTEARAYTDRLEVGDRVFRYSETDAMTASGRFKLNFYAEGVTYQLVSDRRFCSVKYVNLFYHYKNVKENGNGFLGI